MNNLNLDINTPQTSFYSSQDLLAQMFRDSESSSSMFYNSLRYNLKTTLPKILAAESRLKGFHLSS